MSRASLVARPISALLTTLLAVGCAAPSATDSGRRSDGASAESEQDGASKDGSAAGRERALAAARRKAGAAEQAQQLEALESTSKVGGAREEFRAAEFELREAQAALANQPSDARPRTRRAELAIADAESRLIAAHADLAGLVRIYAEEPEVLVKEEILRRKQADVVSAEARLELAGLELHQLVDVELAAELRALEEKQRAASAKVEASQRALEATELGARESRLKAANELLDAQDEVREAEEALAKGDS